MIYPLYPIFRCFYLSSSENYFKKKLGGVGTSKKSGISGISGMKSISERVSVFKNRVWYGYIGYGSLQSKKEK